MDVYLPSVFYYLFAGIIFSVLVLVFTSNEVEKKIKTIVAIGIVAVVILPMIVAFTYRYDFVGFGQGRYYNPLLGMLMLISIIAIEKNTLVFAFSLISLGASLMGVLIAFWRYSFGISTSCCYLFTKVNSPNVWQFGGFNTTWLLMFGAISFLAFISAGYFLLCKQNNQRQLNA
jgi:hypothetical protein